MSRLRRIFGDILTAARSTGRSTRELLNEMRRLRFGRGRLGTSEYFAFKLFENDLTAAEKAAFGGYRAQAVIADIFFDDGAKILLHDKVSTYALLGAFGFPIPAIRAVYASGRRVAPFHCLETADELRRFLGDTRQLPLYLKPAWGSYGRGNTVIRSFENGRLSLGYGSSVQFDEFHREILGSTAFAMDAGATPDSPECRRPFGWILQEVLAPHSAIADACGDKISGVRIHVLLTVSGPRIFRAIWKINVGNKDSDNFQHGASGNMLAAIDVENGSAIRVVSRIGFDQTVNPAHPVTGRSLVGFRLPHWKSVKQVVLDAAVNFPGIMCQGWDVAVCEDGPRLLEINSVGDIDLTQHSHRQGFLDDGFLQFTREHGLEQLLYRGKAIWQGSSITGRRGRRAQHWRW